MTICWKEMMGIAGKRFLKAKLLFEWTEAIEKEICAPFDATHVSLELTLGYYLTSPGPVCLWWFHFVVVAWLYSTFDSPAV